MKKYCLLICVLVAFFGCESNDDINTEPPEIPDAVTLDLNNDGIDDIRFTVGPDDVGVGYAGYVYPLNEALIGLSTESENSWIFDNRLNNTIKKGETNFYTWYPSNLGFISIYNTSEGLWPDEWTIGGQKTSNPLYLGVQIKENDQILVGWLKLEIDKKTGVVDVIDQQFTSDNYIVIDR